MSACREWNLIQSKCVLTGDPLHCLVLAAVKILFESFSPTFLQKKKHSNYLHKYIWYEKISLEVSKQGGKQK